MIGILWKLYPLQVIIYDRITDHKNIILQYHECSG